MDMVCMSMCMSRLTISVCVGDVRISLLLLLQPLLLLPHAGAAPGVLHRRQRVEAGAVAAVIVRVGESRDAEGGQA
jgi:hypothetical protein